MANELNLKGLEKMKEKANKSNENYADKKSLNIDEKFEIMFGQPLNDKKQKENVEEEVKGKIISIKLEKLHQFKNHPFKVKDDEEMMDLSESIKQNGVLTPATIREREDGEYEIISGHRRKRACELAGLKEIPCIIVDYDNEAAIISMVESNKQREKILFSEKAFAYKMQYEAIKSQGNRTDLTSSQLGTKIRADELIARNSDDSRNQIQRYIRLTSLIKPILDILDLEDKTISFGSGVALSYLEIEEQKLLLEYITKNKKGVKLDIAEEIKKQSQDFKKYNKNLTYEDIEMIFNPVKKEQKKKDIKLKFEKIEKYIDTTKDEKEIEEYILQAIEFFEKNKGE